MKVAVVGSGIAGLMAARTLAGRAEVHLFEGAPRPGGHCRTVEVEDGGRQIPVDLGFIVYNERNYPLFSRLLDELGVATVPSDMGFAVSCRATGLEYGGDRLASLVARRRNLFDRRFWAVVTGQVRFARAGAAELASGRERSLADFCRDNGLPSGFVRWYLAPMVGAIWSMAPGRAGAFPAATLLRFFRNHGLLTLRDRPAWRTIQGGSREYVRALVDRLPATLHLGTPVDGVRRVGDGVTLCAAGSEARFDRVVLALHSDQALRALAAPTDAEREVLGAIPYRDNTVVLHRDTSLLPRRRRAWSSWNVVLDGREGESGIAVTYLMNKLQPLDTPTPWCVTLNRDEDVAPELVAHREVFAHPQLDAAAVAAQARWAEIDGSGGVHFAGAYWRYGFHEDGAWSGQRAAEAVVRQVERSAA